MPYLQEEITAENEKVKSVEEESLLLEKQELNYTNLIEELEIIEDKDSLENFKFKFKELLSQDKKYISQAQFQDILELIKMKWLN